ncbi:hypothetical protein PINS_up002143 [Pythium insidiosum]|nr:hypothetical protein PINS_up002143 [Pythium insidiosum]
MPINAPYHSSMEKEIRKATNILNAFFDSTIDADAAIPVELIRNCAGLAFLTVVKAGMIWTGKIGTGVVIARLEDGSWSPPSGIGTAGVGFGAEIGGEIVDFMIILGSRSAVQTFKKGTQVSVGAGLELAIGPVGRAAGANLNAGGGGLSGNYTYSHAKGMFAGVGLHGSTILVRGDMNSKFYGREVSPLEILNGQVQAPPGSCDILYAAIQRASDREGLSVYPSTDPRSQYYNGGASSSASAGSYGSHAPNRGSLSSSTERSSSFSNSPASTSRGSFSSLPPPTTAQPDANDPRLRRYGSYKSEAELYAQFAKNKSSSSSSSSSGGSAYAASAAATSAAYGASYVAQAPAASVPAYNSVHNAPPAQATAYNSAYQAPPAPSSSATYGYAAAPAASYSAPVSNQTHSAPPAAYAPPAKSTPSYSAPRPQAPPIPEPALGAETKEVYTQVINFVSTRCPHANIQIFKDNCRLFGQDQLSLDAYFAYLTSICTSTLLKELVPKLVRLLPTQDKRERLWAMYVRDVLFIRS